jgi:multidrug resistance efflux pump
MCWRRIDFWRISTSALLISTMSPAAFEAMSRSRSLPDGDVEISVDPAPFQYKVSQLRASLAAAQQQTEILKSNCDQATANAAGLASQVAFNAKRLGDIQKLAAEDANTQFQAQDRQNQYETALAQLNVAKAS